MDFEAHPTDVDEGKLGPSGNSLTIPANQELRSCMPRLELDLKFIGSPIERIKSLSQDRIAPHEDIVPIIFTDFTTGAFARRHHSDKQSDEVRRA